MYPCHLYCAILLCAINIVLFAKIIQNSLLDLQLQFYSYIQLYRFTVIYFFKNPSANSFCVDIATFLIGSIVILICCYC